MKSINFNLSLQILSAGFAVIAVCFLIFGEELNLYEDVKDFSSIDLKEKSFKVRFDQKSFFHSQISIDNKEYSILICFDGLCEPYLTFDEDQFFKFHLAYMGSKKRVKEGFSLRGKFYHWLEGEDVFESTRADREIVSVFESFSVFFDKKMRPVESDFNRFLTKIERGSTFHERISHNHYFQHDDKDIYSLGDQGVSILKNINAKSEDKRFIKKFESFGSYLKFYMQGLYKNLKRDEE